MKHIDENWGTQNETKPYTHRGTRILTGLSRNCCIISRQPDVQVANTTTRCMGDLTTAVPSKQTSVRREEELLLLLLAGKCLKICSICSRSPWCNISFASSTTTTRRRPNFRHCETLWVKLKGTGIIELKRRHYELKSPRERVRWRQTSMQR